MKKTKPAFRKTKRSDAPHEGNRARYHTRWTKEETNIINRLIERQPTMDTQHLASRACRELRAAGFNRTVDACVHRVARLRK